MFFEKMMDGFAYHKIIVDKAGKPVDYVFLEVNSAFERMTGLKRENILGKRVTEVMPGIEKDPADWINRYGRVALTGESAEFEDHAVPLGKWFKVSAYSPEKGHFVALFEEITQRKKAEDETARMASFPLLNPNPVVEVDFDCRVQYANPAAKAKFGEALLSSCHPMFADWKQVVLTLQSSPTHAFSREIAIGNNTFYQSLNLVPNSERVRFYAVNIDGLKQAQNALRESEQRWATTVSSIGDAVITTDLNGNVAFLNSVAQSLTCWHGADALGKPLPEVFHIVNEQTRREVESPVSRVLKEGTVVGLANHTILLRKDGSEMPIDDSGAPIKDKSGNVTGVVLIFRDITERKKAQEKIAEQAFMIANANDAIIGYNSKQEVTFWNKAAEQLYGYSAEGALGKLGVDLLKPTYTSVSREELLGKLAAVGHVEMESVRKTKDGRSLNIEAHVILLRNEAGKSIGYVSVDRDITERKRAERALRESEVKFRTVADFTYDWEYWIAPEGNFFYVSPSCERVTGYTAAEFIKDPKLLTRIVHPEDKALVGSHFDLVSSDELHDVSFRIVTRNGETRWISHACQKVFDANGTWSGRRASNRDITERKKAEAELQTTYNRFYNSLSGMHGAVLLVSAEGRVEFANQSFCDYFNLKEAPADLKGFSSAEMIQKIKKAYVHSELEVARIGQIVAAGKVVVSEEVKMADGRTCLRDFIPLKDKGQSSSRLWYHMDITPRKNAEEALKKLNDELEERVEQRTEQVSAERQRLYNVLETLPAYVILLDKDHHVPFANKIFRERFGESHGRRCHEYLFNRYSQCDNCETYKVYDDNQPHHWEWTGPDGRDYDIYDYPFKEADGSTMILEMGIDITERKRAENQVRAASLYTRSLIEASLDPLVTISTEGKITDVNKAAEDATGCTRGELIGSDFSEYFTDPLKAREGYTKVFTDGFVVDYPLALRSKSGKIIDVLYNASVYRNEEGAVQGVFAAARDITQRKLAETELKRHREHLEDVVKERTAELWKAKNDWERTFDSVPDLITLLDNNHGIIRVNQAMAKALGITPQKCVGLTCYEHVHGTKCPPDFCPHAKTVQDGKEHVEEVHEPRLGGDFLVSTTPLMDEEGRMVGSVHVARNITDHKQMQRKLEEYAAHLEELVQERTQQLRDAERLSAIGETAGMVGHDLRNPLQTVTGETFLAKSELKSIPESDAKRNLEESISIIGEQIGYMDKIVSDLQDFVRPINPEKKPVNLQKLLMATLTQVTMPENIEVQTRIKTDLPEVSADGQLLKRVFFNLFTNAVQAMPEGGKLTVRARPRKLGKESPKVVIDFEDTGEGIPENIKTKIFRPLFTTKSKGQGFGLAVCRRVVEAHGGTITFESKKGKGTRFIVELPA
jgi:PAS domain S-box-containing protein